MGLDIIMDFDSAFDTKKPKELSIKKNTDNDTGKNTEKSIVKKLEKSEKADMKLDAHASVKTTDETNRESRIIAPSSRALADKATNLLELKNFVLNFDGCDLKIDCKNTVFSDGSTNAKIMAIGEAPGAEEDLKGIPFCGQSGKLLDKMFSSIGLYREQNLYITNTVFWRPPNNRRPTKKELDICRPFLEKHIALIKPELIIMVGATAVESLLGNVEAITKIRQKYFRYKNAYLENIILNKTRIQKASALFLQRTKRIF